MKILVTLVLAFFDFMYVIAQPPKGEARQRMLYGEKVTAVGALSVDKLAAKMSDEAETKVKIKGKVVEVCTAMGCWLKMETPTGNIMIKMKDHSFFVPLDLNGKEIVVDGVAKTTITPVSELKHYAEDAGKSKGEVAKITTPKKEIVLEARGILVL